MVDTVHISIDRTNLNPSDIKAFSAMFENKSFKAYDNGLSYQYGNIGNMIATVSDHSIKLKGSLQKFYKGENYSNYGFNEIPQAIEKLNDSTKVDWSNSRITRLDLGVNIELDYSPGLYLSRLGASQYYNRLPHDSSVHYRNGQREFVFYDKVKEQKAQSQKHKFEAPKVILGKNLMRVEGRYKKRVSKQLKRFETKLSDLSNNVFAAQLKERFVTEFMSIDKVGRDMNLHAVDVSNPNGFIKALATYALNQIGHQQVFDCIKVLKEREAFPRRESYSRLNGQIRALSTSSLSQVDNCLVNELESKIIAQLASN